MKKIIVLFFFFISAFANSQQAKYWVFLSDKKDTKFNPFEYFDLKTIERRIDNNISLYDSTDFPLNQYYVSEIANRVTELQFESRWFNCVFVDANESQISEIKKLPFVKSVNMVELSTFPATSGKSLTVDEEFILKNQTKRMQGELFEDKNIDGRGVRVAIFDGGFPAVNTHSAFEQIRNENRIIKTFDFTKKKENVYYSISHGTMVMSCIAGISGEQKMGLATGAEFLLAKTEINTEPFSEEKNWLAAAEWADKNGADIINSSLGYTFQRYFVSDMDGKTSLVSRAANMAASKGILVVNSNGNEATSKWKYLGTPADADSVLSIGGIDPFTDYHISFSSYGPTATKKMKPNVCAFGTAVAASKDGLKAVDGTSFSSPLVAGFAACAWQTNRSLSNMQLFAEIEKSADLYPYYDYAHGYGVPQASYFTNQVRMEIAPTFNVEVAGNTIKINIIDTASIHSQKPSYLYYHVQNTKGSLDKYAVVQVNSINVLNLNKLNYQHDETIRIHYKYFTKEFTMNDL